MKIIKLFYPFLIAILLTACSGGPRATPPLTATARDTAPLPSITATLRLPAPTLLPTLTPSPYPSATLSPTVAMTPTQAVRSLESLVDTGDSIYFHSWSPDSSWLAYSSATDLTFHFYNPLTKATCAYPNPLDQYHLWTRLAWSGNETVIIQDGSQLVTGLPCTVGFVPASAPDREVFARKDISISLDGRYQAKTQPIAPTNGSKEFHGTITNRQTGAIVYQLDYNLPGCGGCGEWLGSWLNNDTLLVYATLDEGWLLVQVGKPAVSVISQIFGLPKEKQSDLDWRLNGASVAGTQAYHLVLSSFSEPTLELIYHSETGQIEKLSPMTAPGLSADGRWLEDYQESTDHLKSHDWYRPIDPPGGAWSQLAPWVLGFPDWSPDHRSSVIGTTQDQTELTQFNMLDGSILAMWSNPQYELTPMDWSPDGAFLVVSGREIGNYGHDTLFLIQVGSPAPVTLRSPPLALPYGLAVEEYRLQDRPGFAPNSDALDFKPVGTGMETVLAKHALERADYSTTLYYTNNLALRPFGYRLATDSWVNGQIPNQAALWRLYHYDTLVLSDISEIGPVHTTASGKDFVMTAQLPGRAVLVRKDSVQDYPVSYEDYVGTLGNDLLEAIDRHDSPPFYVEIKRAGQVIQKIPTAISGGVLNFMGLWTDRSHWWVEVLSQIYPGAPSSVEVGDIYLDGISLNQKLGYQDSFNFAYLGGQPFFFYKKDGKIGISYAGQEISLAYGQVLHDGCCSAATFNPRGSSNLVSFFAERDGAWYFVDFGNYLH